jgi:hypothetical protein
MYKFKSYAMAMLAVGSMAFLSSCGDDEEAKPAPTITLGGTNSADATVTAGSFISTDVAITNNNGSNIMSYTVSVSYDGGVAQTIDSETDINEAAFATNFNHQVRTTSGTEVYTFSATNKDGQTSSKKITITVTGNAPTEYTAKIMGASQNTSAGSFFSTSNGTVYSSGDASTNSNKVDFAYFNLISTGGLDSLDATIASPGHSSTQTVYPSVATWGTKNFTEFKTGTGSDYSGATNANLATAFAAAGSTMPYAAHLGAGDVVLFKTAAGKHGVFKVNSVNTTPNAAAGSITIDVKVQP